MPPLSGDGGGHRQTKPPQHPLNHLLLCIDFPGGRRAVRAAEHVARNRGQRLPKFTQRRRQAGWRRAAGLGLGWVGSPTEKKWLIFAEEKFIFNETFSSPLCSYVHISATCGSLGTYICLNSWLFASSWSPASPSSHVCLSLTCVLSSPHPFPPLPGITKPLLGVRSLHICASSSLFSSECPLFSCFRLSLGCRAEIF